MNKAEFGEAMRKKLSGMPEKDIEKAIEWKKIYKETTGENYD